MSGAKARRQRAITELLRTERPASQEELAAKLAGLGIAATQATVSRDLDELGAVKVRIGGRTRYSLPEEIGGSGWAGRRLDSIVREWVRSVEAAGNLVVIKTPPGSAHLVGVALDQAELAGLVGTICGDDTLFAALGSASAAKALTAELRAMSGGTG